jgi:hypothetical protein
MAGAATLQSPTSDSVLDVLTDVIMPVIVVDCCCTVLCMCCCDAAEVRPLPPAGPDQAILLDHTGES